MSARQFSKAGPLSLTSRSLAVCSQDKRPCFEVLMRRHNERLYRTARAILKDESEAEDVMQQAYVKGYSHLRQFDDRFATVPVTDRGQPKRVLVVIGSERDERWRRLPD